MENSQRQIFEQQISLLRSQIEQQDKRQDKLRSLIDTLTQQIQHQRELQQQNFRLEELNSKLIQGLREAKNRHTEEIKYYDAQISRLKEEIHDKIKELQKCRLQNQRKQLVYQQKIAMVESIIEKKCHRVSDLERKLHEQSISKLKQSNTVITTSRNEKYDRSERMSQLGNSVLRVSQISNCFDTENNMRASNLSTVSKRSSRVNDYMKMNKSEIKSLMSAVLKSKKEIEKVTEQSRESYTHKFNKTTLG